MLKQIIQKVKQKVKENIRFFLFFFVLLVVLTFEFPYYIETPGGTIDITDRITIQDGYQSEGSFHLSYVSELKATIPTIIISKFKKDWDIIKKNEVVMENEDSEDVYFRDRLQLEEANQNAIIVAFHRANKELQIIKQQLFVTYIDKLAKTDLKVGDEIIEVEGIPISEKTDLNRIIQTQSVGSVLTITINRNKKEQKVKAEIIELEGTKLIGIILNERLELKTNPKVQFHFKSSESGPSGGLMMTLAIYNQLVKKDITKGKKIVGTGTIDRNGNIGQIAGIKYKLKGAEKGNADIFFVPNGENYEEAIQLKQDLDYEIEIVGVSTFEEALEYLDVYVN